MRRFLPAAGAVFLGFILGLVLAPSVFPMVGGGPGGGLAEPGANASEQVNGQARHQSPLAAEPSETAPAKGHSASSAATESPTESATEGESPESETSPGERADERTGVLDRDIPDSAGGNLEIVPGEQEAPDPDADEIVTVRVEVEAGLPIDGKAFAEFALTTLNDSRSWSAGGAMSFARTVGKADIRLVLASPQKVNELCAPLRTLGLYSCAREGRATINALPYAQATEEILAAGGSHLQYRHYVINHEVGHLLGHSHQGCPGAGELAPVMQQQTITLGQCEPNGWPYPEGE